MNQQTFSHIAHQHHLFHNPISEAKINRIIDLIPLHPNDQIIDIGAGKGELPIRFIEKYGVNAVAIELFEGSIAAGEKNAKGRIPSEKLQFINQDAKEVINTYLNGQFSLGICIGSSHALGGYEETITALRKAVKKGGYILIGEGYWRKKPSPDYLAALGAEESEMKSHLGTIEAAEALGLTALWSTIASEDDWDEYEWLYSMSIENECHNHPDHPDRDWMLNKIRNWRKIYLTWGRDTLGFGLYLFRN
ncbi:class I SAM-dependent methyltransferase [Paenibacillus sediminis]|uniref:Precorrin-6B methylase 2 n=1 Tax=Paenibacillus sediminis TaxID=664909 RepID=A0ABS4H7Y4_9BACL|nr:class I SAM-dependent methyltransferase [Paenibacillus sediminis]MBP1938645.1 precorrin-6B methylase 2 [Paenibacillus sediminis]